MTHCDCLQGQASSGSLSDDGAAATSPGKFGTAGSKLRSRQPRQLVDLVRQATLNNLSPRRGSGSSEGGDSELHRLQGQGSSSRSLADETAIATGSQRRIRQPRQFDLRLVRQATLRSSPHVDPPRASEAVSGDSRVRVVTVTMAGGRQRAHSDPSLQIPKDRLEICVTLPSLESITGAHAAAGLDHVRLAHVVFCVMQPRASLFLAMSAIARTCDPMN